MTQRIDNLLERITANNREIEAVLTSARTDSCTLSEAMERLRTVMSESGDAAVDLHREIMQERR